MQYSTDIRNARLQAVIDGLGASPKFRFYSGAAPANPASAATGTLLAEITAPSTAFAAPAAGAVSMTGDWEDLEADATGTIGYCRGYVNDGSACKAQLTVSDPEGDGEVKVSALSVTTGQAVSIDTFTITEGNP